MWRIYSPNKDSVRVSTTVEKLFTTIYNSSCPHANISAFIGKVQYGTTDSINDFIKDNSFFDVSIGGQNDGIAKTLLIKRSEFSHESEVRLLFNDQGKQFLQDGIATFDFPVNDIVDDVLLDPRLDRGICFAHETMFRKIGFMKPIERSKLYDAPKLIINI
ncbi:DUF2971 domain-containing protein [Komagataeibacter europaeus]|uniref:DUF2971 domain-containing protein n=1 Tax=Komagataeibacter europaeus TaxID=33995 RepID=UPI0013791FB4|nr:DUF2971 domain-containing protein [Komagataeibacter europaeus]